MQMCILVCQLRQLDPRCRINKDKNVLWQKSALHVDTLNSIIKKTHIALLLKLHPMPKYSNFPTEHLNLRQRDKTTTRHRVCIQSVCRPPLQCTVVYDQRALRRRSVRRISSNRSEQRQQGVSKVQARVESRGGDELTVNMEGKREIKVAYWMSK